MAGRRIVLMNQKMKKGKSQKGRGRGIGDA